MVEAPRRAGDPAVLVRAQKKFAAYWDGSRSSQTSRASFAARGSGIKAGARAGTRGQRYVSRDARSAYAFKDGWNLAIQRSTNQEDSLAFITISAPPFPKRQRRRHSQSRSVSSGIGRIIAIRACRFPYRPPNGFKRNSMVAGAGDSIACTCYRHFCGLKGGVIGSCKTPTADSPPSDASARSRTTTARRLSRSFFDVWWRLTFLPASNRFQVTLFTFHELTSALYHAD